VATTVRMLVVACVIAIATPLLPATQVREGLCAQGFPGPSRIEYFVLPWWSECLSQECDVSDIGKYGCCW
jgi:hypothetical protein